VDSRFLIAPLLNASILICWVLVIDFHAAIRRRFKRDFRYSRVSNLVLWSFHGVSDIKPIFRFVGKNISEFPDVPDRVPFAYGDLKLRRSPSGSMSMPTKAAISSR
jgi:hypothetical protein